MTEGFGGTRYIVQIASVDGKRCEEGDEGLFRDLDGFVNHYREKHNYTLLHIGQKGRSEPNGESYFQIAAPVGK